MSKKKKNPDSQLPYAQEQSRPVEETIIVDQRAMSLRTDQAHHVTTPKKGRAHGPITEEDNTLVGGKYVRTIRTLSKPTGRLLGRKETIVNGRAHLLNEETDPQNQSNEHKEQHQEQSLTGYTR